MSYEKLYDTQGRVKGYKVRWRDSSGRSRRRTVRREKDAILLDAEMKRKKAMGELVVHEKGRIELCDFWDVWWTNYAAVNLAPRTLAVYRRLWMRHINPTLGRSSLQALSPEHCSSLAATLSKTLAPSSTRKVLAILQGVLQRAVEWGYIPVNPAKGVRRPRLISRRGRALTVDQLAALTSELDTRSASVVKVLALTGLRPGELRALRWENLSQSVIHVEHAVSLDVVGPTKTYHTRTVELRDEARKALLEWYVASGQPAPHKFIFQSRFGGVWTDRGWNSWQQEVLTPAAERAGLKGLVGYDLRHTFATTLIHEGGDPVSIARQMGHSLQTLLTTYAHEFDERKSVPSECPAKQSITEILSAGGRSGASS